jgi:hypothetical protein
MKKGFLLGKRARPAADPPSPRQKTAADVYAKIFAKAAIAAAQECYHIQTHSCESKHETYNTINTVKTNIAMMCMASWPQCCSIHTACSY